MCAQGRGGGVTDAGPSLSNDVTPSLLRSSPSRSLPAPPPPPCPRAAHWGCQGWGTAASGSQWSRVRRTSPDSPHPHVPFPGLPRGPPGLHSRSAPLAVLRLQATCGGGADHTKDLVCRRGSHPIDPVPLAPLTRRSPEEDPRVRGCSGGVVPGRWEGVGPYAQTT